MTGPNNVFRTVDIFRLWFTPIGSVLVFNQYKPYWLNAPFTHIVRITCCKHMVNNVFAEHSSNVHRIGYISWGQIVETSFGGRCSQITPVGKCILRETFVVFTINATTENMKTATVGDCRIVQGHKRDRGGAGRLPRAQSRFTTQLCRSEMEVPPWRKWR